MLRVREIDFWRSREIEAAVLDVADDADDGFLPAADVRHEPDAKVQLLPDRTSIWPEPSRGLLVDDHDFRAALVVVISE